MPMRKFHYQKLPDGSGCLSCQTPPTDWGFQSDHLFIWYHNGDAQWVQNEREHMHTQADEAFIVLQGTLTVRVNGEYVKVGPREFCCFPAGMFHAVVEASPNVETIILKAPMMQDKIYREQANQ